LSVASPGVAEPPSARSASRRGPNQRKNCVPSFLGITHCFPFAVAKQQHPVRAFPHLPASVWRHSGRTYTRQQVFGGTLDTTTTAVEYVCATRTPTIPPRRPAASPLRSGARQARRSDERQRAGSPTVLAAPSAPMTPFPIQCHAREGGHPGPEGQHPPAFPPLDPGLRRDDIQRETRPQGRLGGRWRSESPLFVAARAKRVGRVNANVPAHRRPLRWGRRRRYEECWRSESPFFVAARAERVGPMNANVPAYRRPWRPPLRRGQFLIPPTGPFFVAARAKRVGRVNASVATLPGDGGRDQATVTDLASDRGLSTLRLSLVAVK